MRVVHRGCPVGSTGCWRHLLKQADVVMLTYVLPDEFCDDVKRANYEYYER
jgi:trehalose/maltose hydrolase-like predicted phosphorylase